MDPEEFENKKKKVSGTNTVSIEKGYYLNPKYEIKLLSNHPTTSTGLVKVVELFTDTQYPTFLFRWDDRAEELDVDIIKNTKDRKDLWGKSGYKGHNTKKVDERAFESKIEIPQLVVFKGIIQVGLRLSLSLKDNARTTENIKSVQKNKVEDEGSSETKIEVNKRAAED